MEKEELKSVFMIMFAPPNNPHMPYNKNVYLSERDAQEDYQKAIDNCRIDHTRFMMQEFIIKRK
jgi:hypothetical protein